MRTFELPDPINHFVETVNRGDTKSFLDFFTSDGVVYDSGRRFDSQEAIRKWSDREFIGAKGHITVTDIELTNNGFLLKADWKSNYFTGPSRFTFELQDKKIKNYTFPESSSYCFYLIGQRKTLYTNSPLKPSKIQRFRSLATSLPSIKVALSVVGLLLLPPPTRAPNGGPSDFLAVCLPMLYLFSSLFST